MGNPNKRRWTSPIGLTVLATITGCTSAPTTVAGNIASFFRGAPSSGILTPGAPGAPPMLHSGGPLPGVVDAPPQGPAPITPVVHETPSQSIAMLSQKLAAVEDERKVLVGRIGQLENQLEARDQALAVSSREIEATRAEIASTRDEMERWKREMGSLRERLRKVEKENEGTLESIIKMLEQTAQKEQAPPARPSVDKATPDAGDDNPEPAEPGAKKPLKGPPLPDS